MVPLFDGLERKEKLGLAGAAVLLVALGAGIGVASTGSGTPTGYIAASDGAGSEAAVRQAVQGYMDRVMQRQRQRLRMVANRSENLTRSDLSIDATVSSVTQSKFGSLYRVNVTVSGTMPSRLGSGTRDVRQEQTVYVSQDGRYLFREPTDLQQPRRPTGTRGRR